MSQAGYTPVGDLLTVIITLIMLSMLTAGHTKRNAGYRSFLATISCIFISAISNVTYYAIRQTCGTDLPSAVDLFDSIHYIALFAVQLFNVYYLARLVALKGRNLRIVLFSTVSVFALCCIVELHIAFTRIFGQTDSPMQKFPLYSAAFIYFSCWIFFILIRNRHRIVHLVHSRLILTYLFCIWVRAVQGSHHQTSFTTAIYLLPIFQIMYFFHQTPFDANTNAFDEYAFANTIRTAGRKHERLILACLHLYDYERVEALPEDMRFDLYHFFSLSYHASLLFCICAIHRVYII